MVKGGLPGEGPVRLGPVTLPAGKLITGYPGTDHVAWVTADPVPGSSRIWAALSELHPRTGLIPIQVDGQAGRARHPLDLFETEDPREADRLDASILLEDMWRDWIPLPDEDDPEWIETRAPRIAAEQVVLADEGTGGARYIPGIAERLVNAPIWTFWWD
jgi:hypothetical protein